MRRSNRRCRQCRDVCGARVRAKTARALSCWSARRSAERGGNSTFTAGAIRVAYNTLDDLLELLPDLSDEEKANTDFGTYSEDQFFEDMGRVTQYRTDPDMVELLVRRSHATLKWMRGEGDSLRADLRPSGVQGRRQIQILGRPDDRGVGRRARPHRGAAHDRAGRWSPHHLQRACDGAHQR